MTLILLIVFLILFPLVAQAEDPGAILDALGALHPAVLPGLAIVWGIMKVADIFIPEGKKGSWPTLVRKIWDGLLLHIGESRNSGSPDA